MPRRSSTKDRRPEGPGRAVIYTRLSNDRGEEGKIPHRTQEEGCRRKAEALGMEVIRVVSDNISGDRLDRPGLFSGLRMLEDAEATCLIAYSFDRLARDQAVQNAIVAKAEDAGGRVISATEELPEDPALAYFLRGAYTLGAQIELMKIRERTTRSHKARFVDKKRYKRSRRPPYGYQHAGDETYVEHPVEAAVVRRIFADAAAGVSRRKLAAGLTGDGIPTPNGKDRWSERTVTIILERETYWTGEHEMWTQQTVRDSSKKPKRLERPKEQRYVVPFPPLILPEDAEAARNGIARNVWRSARDDRPGAEGILRYGFAVCGGCGRAMSVVAGSKTRPRYACTHPKQGYRRCPSPTSVYQPDLDEAVVREIREVAFDPVRAASRWVIEDERPEVDPVLLARLGEAERRVAEAEARVRTLAKNMALATGRAAVVYAEQMNEQGEELAAAEAERDRLASEVARKAYPARKVRRRISPETAIARQVERALAVGWEAFRKRLHAQWEGLAAENPEMFLAAYSGEQEALDERVADQTSRVLPPALGSEVCWHAWQAILAVLGTTVVVNATSSGRPRWEVRLSLPAGELGGSCGSHHRGT